MDYIDYGYVAIDTQVIDETVRDPSIPKKQDCLFINAGDLIDFDDDIFMRRFYWESFSKLTTIIGK